MGADVDSAGKDGWTPACIAGQAGQVEILRLLGERGVPTRLHKRDFGVELHALVELVRDLASGVANSVMPLGSV